jgi:hypothetical protein
MAVKDDAAEDKALGKIIAEKLREQIQAEPAGCPDMETLSAYYERTLSPGERTVCESHLMTCSRCQVFIAELARLSEADEKPVIVGEPEIEVAEETGFHFHLAWVTPFVVVLVIAGIWYGDQIRNYIRPPQETAEEEPSLTSPAQEAAKGKEQKTGAAPERKSAEAAREAGAEEKKEVAAAAPPANVPGSAKGGQQPAGSGISIKGEVGKSAPGGAGGEMAAPSVHDRFAASAPVTRMLQIPAGARRAESTDRALAAAPVSAAPATTRQDAREAGRLAKQAAGAPPPALTNYTIQGSTPTYQSKWRVGRGGLIQHYDPDRGWVDIPSGVRADLFDVTFSTATVGWIVGHEGTVLRSTDGGSNWNKVSSPTSEDLVRVSAMGNQKAQVMSRSGRAFVTNDAGKSWIPVGEQ